MAIFSVRGAIPFYVAVFLNASIDLGHKITIQNTIFKVHDGALQVMLTATINALILLPYILLFVPIGLLANRVVKPKIMRVSAWCSLFLTIFISFFYQQGFFWLAFTTTFLMSVQSAFYSPAKLSYLKILFGKNQLSASNGLAQAVAILGILLATLLFSLGFEWLFTKAGLSDNALTQVWPVTHETAYSESSVLPHMLPLGLVLVALSILQLLMVYRVPVLSELKRVSSGVHTAKKQSFNALITDPKFLLPVLGLSLFWAVGQGMLAVFPAYAKAYAGITNTAVIQAILACVAIGIALGATTVGRFSAAQVKLNWALWGLLLMAVGMAALTYLQAAWQYALDYLLLGVASGMLLVPLNAYLQLNASGENIGSVIASSNLIQNTAMLLTLLITIVFAWLGLDSLNLLKAMTVFMAVAGLFLAKQIRKLY